MLGVGRWKRTASVAVLALAGLAGHGCRESGGDDPGELRGAARIEGAPMVPWRDPAGDIARWFPGANRGETEIRILSALRPELAQRLGRPPTAEENALHLHRVLRDTHLLGEVATRRVKGESGAVELSVALDSDRKLRGVRIQRTREPAMVAAAIGETWLDSFRGLLVDNPETWRERVGVLPPPAQGTAQAVANGIRDVLILRELADAPGAVRRPAPESSATHRH